MKALVSPALIAGCLFATSNTQAAQLQWVANGHIATIYLNAAQGADYDGDLNDMFDTIDFAFTPATGVTLTNCCGDGPRPPGEPFTYRNRLLDADPLDGGLGWSIVGQTINASLAKWVGGPHGGTINTGDPAGGGLFLQNMHFSSPASNSSGTGRVLLIRAGTIIAEMPLIPEPSSFAMASAAAVLALRRRRR